MGGAWLNRRLAPFQNKIIKEKTELSGTSNRTRKLQKIT